ncbi:hypothetical protein CYMTET_19266 [Cymbomonas tetramitiformis]|uniref:Cyclin-like domain-containing protein n=1 Tax=Cymbomonas tetramitiformis TaxID=36881 RepID=A0AAE0G6C6_9CHLO|nr:hypothetical protein CYMTET_19266 [Cymbomonas tetramitiformis]
MPGLPYREVSECGVEWRDQDASILNNKPCSIPSGYQSSPGSTSPACEFHFEEVRLIQALDGHEDIVRSLFDREQKFPLGPGYLTKLRSSKRCRLGDHRRRIVHWMFETQKELETSLSTTLLAIRYLDTILAREVIQGDVEEVFDLFGTACLFVAFKFDCTENGCYSVSEIQAVSHNVFRVQDVVQAERHILRLLNWDLNPVTPMSYISHLLCSVCPLWSVPAAVWKELWMGASKHLQQCCHDVRILEFSSSEIASAAVLLALDDNDLQSEKAQRKLDELTEGKQEIIRRCRSVFVDIELDSSDWTSLLLHCEEAPGTYLYKDQLSSTRPFDTEFSPRSVLS